MAYNNFRYSFPTEYIFGEKSIEQLPMLLSKDNIKRICLIYGTQSIVITGIYDKLMLLLEQSDIIYMEIKGAGANPKTDFVEAQGKKVKQFKPDLILAVGGGSVIDASKAIAIYCSNDIGELFWENMIQRKFINDAIPIGVIATNVGTGSEVNSSYVITNSKTNQKVASAHLSVRPLFAICDPIYTLTMSKEQLECAYADIMSHLLEQLLVVQQDTQFIDNLICATIRSLIDNREQYLKQPHSIDIRSNLVLISSYALSYMLSCGRSGDWIAHTIEHAISGQYDTAHGAGLAVIMPHWLRYVEENSYYTDKLTTLGKVGFGNVEYKKAIKQMELYFQKLDLPKNLQELVGKQIGLEQLVDAIVGNETIGRNKLLTKEACGKLIEQML